ncbi:SDR family oxidoreductase [Allosediminivita pacifica]|uniref:NAD(P)-dependent dehydrogenase (Short-subunit alcohol dehydrogenase family) n=1 Tax=Allosediminivita pacifica TaxID=1267769 RepID=A0A2T6AUL4_9RHOB|nr:SDR family oxidoreductase [Allosediminivita pacifica]PTX47497.1 NAD(P)-dependent dehydrogenase (short-subunit alcohol dehydrogenase family) [Allosediminivita pacifica]GGB14621.1 3-ketoacyl-ACP reductase [Allosediminivita pacifica]
MSDRQRVVITGGAAGIGLVLARRFAAEGARIAVCDVDDTALAALREEMPDAIVEKADAANDTEMGAFLDRVEREWHGADVVCSNAGTGGPAGPIETLNFDAWRACLEVNLLGAFLTCRWAARVMKAQGSGLLLLTSSNAGLFGYPGRSPYATSKWGVIGLMKTLAMELGPHGVRVNALCPAAVEGPRMDRVVAAEAEATGATHDEIRTRYVKGVSLRSWVTADEVADAALFLASPAARKISGQALSIDGHTETLVP